MNQKIIGDSISQLLSNLNRIYETLKFADQKAGVLIAANSTILAVSDTLLKSSTASTLRVAAFIGAIGLVAGTALAFSVIVPRGNKVISKRSVGIVDSYRINAHSSLEEYLKIVSTADVEDFISELHLMQYDYSVISCIKYSWLRKSIWVSAVAWVITLTSIALSKY